MTLINTIHKQMRPAQGCTKTEIRVLPQMGRWLSSTMARSEESSTNETVLLFRIHLLPHAVKQPPCVTYSSEEAALSPVDQQRQHRWLHHLWLNEASHQRGEFQPGRELPHLIASVFWQSDTSIIRQKQSIQSWKFISFYLLRNLRVGKHAWKSLWLRVAAWWGRRRVRLLTSLRTSVASIERAHSVITDGSEGTAEWFVPACVLTKVAESNFTESASYFFAVWHNQ